MTMDYSPWSEREIWPFLKVAISPKAERPCSPKLVYMHATLTPTCMNFLSRFRSIKFFDYSPWSEREIWPFLKVAISPKVERPRSPKLVYMHAISMPTGMNCLSRFRSIKFFDDHGSQKLLYMHVTSTPTGLNFLSRFRLIKFFDDHGLVHGQKGKFGRF